MKNQVVKGGVKTVESLKKKALENAHRRIAEDAAKAKKKVVKQEKEK